MKKLTAKDLLRLALERKAVTFTRGPGRMPAAFLISMQFHVVMRFLASGVYEYKPKKKIAPPFPKTELLKSNY